MRTLRGQLSSSLAAVVTILSVFAWFVPSSPASAGCELTSLGILPLNDLGGGSYKGFAGGLYPQGSNTRPDALEAEAVAIASQQIQPRDAAGRIDPGGGKVVMISVGMSNTTQEFATGSPDAFKPQADREPAKNPKLVIVDGAQGGQAADAWTSASAATWQEVDRRLAAAGVSPQQVQVAWVKQAEREPGNLGAFPQHAQTLQRDLEAIARALKVRYPNVAIAYYSSRTRAYNDDPSSLNPEPYAYESGFAVKWLIESQIRATANLNYGPTKGAVVAPLLLWGPYLWTDGTTPRSDGLIWECSDLKSGDNVHPSASGVKKVADQLLAFFKTDPTARPWFLKSETSGQPPTCQASAGPDNGSAPLDLHFSAIAANPDGSVVAYAWTFDDGGYSLAQNPAKRYPVPGTYRPRLTVVDDAGNPATCTTVVLVRSSGSDPTPTPTPPPPTTFFTPTPPPPTAVFTPTATPPSGDHLPPQIVRFEARPATTDGTVTLTCGALDSGGSHLARAGFLRAADQNGLPDPGTWVELRRLRWTAGALEDEILATAEDLPPPGISWYSCYAADGAGNVGFVESPLRVASRRSSTGKPTFRDVPLDHWAYLDIETLFRAGFTKGCTEDGADFCPAHALTRAENAVFQERAVHGAEYIPQDPTNPHFQDTRPQDWFTNWVEGLWLDGLTAGCQTNPPLFCPARPLPNKEGAVFALRVMYGDAYDPPPATGIFTDLAHDWSDAWVEAAFHAGLLAPCQPGPAPKICPEALLSRAMTAHMVVLAKGLTPPPPTATPQPTDPATPTPTAAPSDTPSPTPSGTQGPTPTVPAGGRYLDALFSSFKVTRDIVYGRAVRSDSGETVDLKLDVWEPEGDQESARAVFIWLHGNQGDKGDEKTVSVARAYASRGYVTLAINHRYPVADLMAHPDRLAELSADFKAAIRWARANAARYRLDPDKIAIGGSSAGGVGSLAGAYMEGDGNSGNPGYSSEVSAEIACAGALDSAELDPGEAPLMIIHGLDDPLVPVIFAQMLEARAKAVGVPVEAHFIPGIGHGSREWMLDHMDVPLRFLYKHMIAR